MSLPYKRELREFRVRLLQAACRRFSCRPSSFYRPSKLQLDTPAHACSHSFHFHFRAASRAPLLRLADRCRISYMASQVTEDALLPVGTPLTAAHFVPGQEVDVSGLTRGHGFAGGMKRHGFKGQNATHGNSVSHRALGSTGCRQDPGRVWKGKKMPGRMGAERITVQNVTVFKVDPARGLIYVKGQARIACRAGSFAGAVWQKRGSSCAVPCQGTIACSSAPAPRLCIAAWRRVATARCQHCRRGSCGRCSSECAPATRVQPPCTHAAADAMATAGAQVPGHAGAFLEVKDAIRAKPALAAPFPTFVGKVAGMQATVAPAGDDPFEKQFTHIPSSA